MMKNKVLSFLMIGAVTLAITSCDDSAKSDGGGLTSNPQYNSAEGKLNAKKNPFIKEKKTNEVKKVTGPTADITFEENRHDFGNIVQNEKYKHMFKFKNNSEHPLLIESARGSCGCTVPKFPKEPVAPGAEGEIEVVFSSGKKKGKQNKTVTIVANTNPVQTKLVIEAMIEVEEKKEAAK